MLHYSGRKSQSTAEAMEPLLLYARSNYAVDVYVNGMRLVQMDFVYGMSINDISDE